MQLEKACALQPRPSTAKNKQPNSNNNNKIGEHQGLRGEGMKSCLMSIGFRLCKMKKLLPGSVNILTATDLYNLKW